MFNCKSLGSDRKVNLMMPIVKKKLRKDSLFAVATFDNNKLVEIVNNPEKT